MKIQPLKVKPRSVLLCIDGFIEVIVKQLPKGKLTIASVFGGSLSRPLKKAVIKRAAVILKTS